MAALCPDANPEMLWPLCCRRTLHLLGDLCHCLHKGSQALQAEVTLSACHVLQNSRQFIVRGLRSALPESQFSALMKARRFLHRHSWVVLAFWAGTESCWKTHSWPLKRVIITRLKPKQRLRKYDDVLLAPNFIAQGLHSQQELFEAQRTVNK